VGVVDLGMAGSGEMVTSHFARPSAGHLGHHQLVAFDPGPDHAVGQRVGHRIQHAAEADGGRPRDVAGLAEDGGVGDVGQPVQVEYLFAQHLGRGSSGDPVGPVVHLVHELVTGHGPWDI